MTDASERPPFDPGEPMCRNCGAKTSIVDPGPHDRCQECKAHLRHCRNCMFRTLSGCLLHLKYRWPSSGLPGQDCPRFLWRDDDVTGELDADSLTSEAGSTW